MTKALTIYYYPGHWIHLRSRTYVHNLHSVRSIPAGRLLGAHMLSEPHSIRILPGTHFLHLGWGEACR